MPKKTTDKTAYYLAPGLLLLVAILQLFLTHAHHLSPWKGGGFGMFSVVDSPGTRFLFVEGRDLNGNPVLVEPEKTMDKGRWLFLQSMPTQGELNQLARELMESELVPAGRGMRSALERFQDLNPDIPVTGMDEPSPEVVIYRVKNKNDPGGKDVARLSAIRLRLWRLRFHEKEMRVYAEPLLSTVSEGAWP